MRCDKTVSAKHSHKCSSEYIEYGLGVSSLGHVATMWLNYLKQGNRLTSCGNKFLNHGHAILFISPECHVQYSVLYV